MTAGETRGAAAALPVRGPGARRLDLALPPERMPPLRRGRPLKRWRYVGVYGPELMLCAARARVGPLRQDSWAVVERGGELRERTTLRSGGVRFEGSRLAIDSGDVRVDLELEEDNGIEVVSPSGAGYVWTRKQAGLPARGRVSIGSRRYEIAGEAAVDETAGYHERHCRWSWSIGVGRAASGERVAWNVAAGSGVHDGATGSERTIWVDGEPREIAPVDFGPELDGIGFRGGGALRFEEWAAREDRTNLLLLRSSYRQPFGTFSGELPGGLRLEAGYGVMESHDVYW